MRDLANSAPLRPPARGPPSALQIPPELGQLSHDEREKVLRFIASARDHYGQGSEEIVKDLVHKFGFSDDMALRILIWVEETLRNNKPVVVPKLDVNTQLLMTMERYFAEKLQKK
jgi:hypothetical protein